MVRSDSDRALAPATEAATSAEASTTTASDERRADKLVRSMLALADPALRMATFVNMLERTRPVPRGASAATKKLWVDLMVLAGTLDALARRGELAEESAREVLVTLADALALTELRDVVQLLREEAAGRSLLALGRLLRTMPVSTPASLARVTSAAPDPKEERVPDYGTGRTLTLGERKALARRPDRVNIDRLLRDPHPEVIRKLLGNPKLTEDDVVLLVSKRPSRADVLSEIARSPKWVHRARIRLSLVLNPDLPVELASLIAGLLIRHELRMVAQSTHVPAPIRALCLEHLARRPPTRFPDDPPPSKLQ